MSDIAIRVENLGKSYRIGRNAEKAERYTALRDVISRNARNLLRTTRDVLSGQAIVQGDEVEEFWALKGVNFEVRQGEVLGVIGRNGSGKSTLLKILSRITEPTMGRVELHGRVASLLEVGTGFHPELSGRENIYLNGAILGMARREVDRQFDEIVAFAGVEKFLDTPVKRYSSGMYVRLAFAVAAHLEQEILIVDEVLAVGDAQFQQKCLGAMGRVARQGRAVILVSHNLPVVQAFCERCLLLDAGRLSHDGHSPGAIAAYANTQAKRSYLQRLPKSDGGPTITRLEIRHLKIRDVTEILVAVTVLSNISLIGALELKVSDAVGTPIGIASVGLLNPSAPYRFRPGMEVIVCTLTLPRLARGPYSLMALITLPLVQIVDVTDEPLVFDADPEPHENATRVLEASWGFGPLEIPLKIERSLDCIPS